MPVRGRRRPDVRLGDLPDDIKPGDIWRYLAGDGKPCSAAAMYPNSQSVAGNLTDEVWGYMSPDGNGIGTLGIHTVRSHDDGTVSIRPGDGSSNSVLHSGGAQHKTWHGYVDHCVWEPC